MAIGCCTPRAQQGNDSLYVVIISVFGNASNDFQLVAFDTRTRSSVTDRRLQQSAGATEAQARFWLKKMNDGVRA